VNHRKGNLLYGQSGGPTAVINASAYGVIREALHHSAQVEKIFVMKHGIQGALREEFYLISNNSLWYLKNIIYAIFYIMVEMIRWIPVQKSQGLWKCKTIVFRL